MTPILSDYDWIVVSSSAGKDSLAMLDYVCEKAEIARVLQRVVVVHADLGRVEWKGTYDLAQTQAERYEVEFLATSRRQGDLLEHVERRGRWPSPQQRYCTSDHKRAQIHRVYTRLVNETIPLDSDPAPVRILSCQGMRAEESPARAKRPPFQRDERASNGRRAVDNWLPIHAWGVDDVWRRVRNGRAWDLVHPAYALGMPRLSCVFCIFAPKAALVLAGRHNPELLAEYVRVENAIGHRFRVDLSLAEVQAAVNESATPDLVADWKM